MITANKKTINDHNYIDFCNGETSFDISFGGADLYWCLDDYKEDNEFIIDKEDKYWFSLFNFLFTEIKKVDDKFDPTIKENTFEWISDAHGVPEEANKLRITLEIDRCIIKFIRNPLRPFSMCAISFCPSGSRYNRIVQLFTMMFIRLCEMDNNYKGSSKSLLKYEEKTLSFKTK